MFFASNLFVITALALDRSSSDITTPSSDLAWYTIETPPLISSPVVMFLHP